MWNEQNTNKLGRHPAAADELIQHGTGSRSWKSDDVRCGSDVEYNNVDECIQIHRSKKYYEIFSKRMYNLRILHVKYFSWYVVSSWKNETKRRMNRMKKCDNFL
jgi:hypothetical protein